MEVDLSHMTWQSQVR